MPAIKIVDGVHWVGIREPELQIFDLVMYTKYGTSYNAYLVQGSEKTVLIEVCEEKFLDEYLEKVKEVVSLDKIDYLILNHTEPDHTDAVEKLLKVMPDLEIMASHTAITFLKEITNNRKFKYRELQDGDELDLGGKTLQFIHAPFLHWPDTIYTYLKQDRLLFPCDSFGSHYPDERLFNDLMEYDFMDTFQEYFEVIIGPFRPYVLEALDKIKDLEIDAICPGHGPVLRKDWQKYVELYREWSTPPAMPEDAKEKIIVAYVSSYGYTGRIADSIIEGIQTIGEYDIKKYNLIETALDEEEKLAEILEELKTATGLLIGSPTINGDALPPIWKLLTRLSPVTNSGLVSAAFGSYGWSGEAVPNIENRLKMLRMKVLPGLKINFKPSEHNLEEAFTFGMDYARAIIDFKQPVTAVQWKCLVCGHIHTGAEPPDICPACGVGKENFVRLMTEDEFSNDTNEKFVIIGSGIAALSSAQAIRKRNKTCSITMVTDEDTNPYYRPILSDMLTEEIPYDSLYVMKDEWYKQNRVDVKTEELVTAIDTKGKSIVTEHGDILLYDKLIIATGARSNVPPIPGADKQGVYTMRTLRDATRLKSAISIAQKAVVVGGGVLGLEAVWEMLSAGLDVTVVEFAPRIMPRQLDESSSQRLQDIMLKKGLHLYLDMGTDAIVGDDKVSGVRLKDGTVLEADLVLLSTGVKPNLELAQAAGIGIDKGIIVDAGMRTNAPDVYAAGDVAQFGERMIGLWPVSIDMGKTAGAAAAGDWVEYHEPVISTMLSAFDMEFFSIGDVNHPEEEVRVVVVNDPKENYFKKTFFKDGVMVGEIVIAPKVDSSEAMRNLGRDSSGKRRAQKWVCRVCGYVHEGPEPPDECPVCGAPKEMFDPVF